MRDCCWINSRRSSVLLHFIALISLVAVKRTVVVRTTTGPVQGRILTTVNSVNYAAFQGIPFAKPPTGYLRFKPPVAIEPWTETLNAVADGPDCIQPGSKPDTVVGSEDCLFINVYTPETDLQETPRKLKPVMVWIYGGAFVTGSSSMKAFHPDYLLEKDVVFVAFNYRLGSLGFLGLSHPNATGNVGLKDQVLALKWVKRNIRKFGGNPKKVTIFGQSAGSASVGYHVLSDASKGLFQGAIGMSGVPLNPWAFRTPEKILSRAKQLGVLLGTDSDDKEVLLKTFYDATAEEIVQATSKIGLGIMPFSPTIEDKSIATDAFLTKCSLEKYNSGNFNKVPQMLGYTDQEMISFASISTKTAVATLYEALNVYNDHGLNISDNPLLVDNLVNTATEVLNQLGPAGLEAFINVSSDVILKAHIDLTQKILAEKNGGKPVYYYHLSFFTNRSLHNIKTNSTLLGAGHSDDLAYVFYNPKANYSTDPTDPTRRTIDRVSTMWTNFAKYGNPTPEWVHDDTVNINWPDSGHLGFSLDIGTELTVGLRPISKNAKLIQDASLPLLHALNSC